MSSPDIFGCFALLMAGDIKKWDVEPPVYGNHQKIVLMVACSKA